MLEGLEGLEGLALACARTWWPLQATRGVVAWLPPPSGAMGKPLKFKPHWGGSLCGAESGGNVLVPPSPRLRWACRETPRIVFRAAPIVLQGWAREKQPQGRVTDEEHCFSLPPQNCAPRRIMSCLPHIANFLRGCPHFKPLIVGAMGSFFSRGGAEHGNVASVEVLPMLPVLPIEEGWTSGGRGARGASARGARF